MALAANGKGVPTNPVVGGTEPKKVEATVETGKGSAEYVKDGREIIAAMDEERRVALGSKSHTLKFQTLLGLASKKGGRRVSADQNVNCSTPVGVALVSEEDITVPQIDVRLTTTTGVQEDQITYKQVKAGELFHLTYIEFMYLITRDEYAGFCANGVDPQGIKFIPKFPKFSANLAKLPTPTINAKGGAIKASILDIDEKGKDGQWKIKDEYAEKFGALLTKKTPSRDNANTGDKNVVPAPMAVAIALQKVLGTAKK